MIVFDCEGWREVVLRELGLGDCFLWSYEIYFIHFTLIGNLG